MGSNSCTAAKHNTLFSRANRTDYVPIVIVSGQGARVRDTYGREYIDLSSSGAVMNLGYGDSAVREAVVKQAKKLIHYTYMYGLNEPAIELAERLVRLSPIPSSKVLYALSGSDAVESALMLAKAFTGREIVLAFMGGFHGVFPMGADASCLEVERDTCLLTGCRRSTICLPYPDPYRCPLGDEDGCRRLSLERLESVINEFEGKDNMPAALIAEPVQGDSGIIVPPEGFFRDVERLLRRKGILLIMDEIQTGMGRTGKWFGFQHDGIVPDIITLGKPLGGGMPLSAVIGRQEIMDSLPIMSLAFSLAGNPVACAAAVAAIEEIERNKLVERSKRLGEEVLRDLKAFAGRHPIVGDVRGKGLMIGIDIVKDRSSKERDIPAAKKIIYRAFQLGVIIFSVMGNVLRLQPPLNIPEEDLREGLEVLKEAIEDVEAGKVGDEALKVVSGW